MYTVEHLYEQYKMTLGLDLVAGKEGIKSKISIPEAHRPGLSLTGYINGYERKRIVVYGRYELRYLKDLDEEVRKKRLEEVIKHPTPAIIIARGYKPLKEVVKLCNQKKIPLFRTKLKTMSIIGKLTMLLNGKFAPYKTVHGTLVEVFGVGVLIKGNSAVGKSEAALGLIERGHRLVSDDVVKVVRREESYLEGYGIELTRHHMEVRGIGIINVANIYGAVCVRESKSIDLIVKLEEWNDDTFYDRIGLEEQNQEILGLQIPFHVLPVKPGRDVVLLLETIALNHRLKAMGYHSAKEFSKKVDEFIGKKSRRKKSFLINKKI